MNEQLETKPVAETIRNMRIGNSETFPIKQMSGVRNTIYRLGKMEKLKFSTATTDNSIIVTRLN